MYSLLLYLNVIVYILVGLLPYLQETDYQKHAKEES